MTGPLRTEPCDKRIRVYCGGARVADSTHVLYVWSERPYPTYFFPLEDVQQEHLHASGPDHFDLRVGERVVPDAAYARDDVPDRVSFRWAAMDHWFEEDEEVYVHARDPHTRIDILPSSRPVRVEIDSVAVADTRHPTLLFETGLPTRFYFSKSDVRFDLLVPSDRATACPYKGVARYWSVPIGDAPHPDIAWSYDDPLPESTRIAGLVAFYNERVDLVVDGVHRGARFL
jgi:uncharacterized protein (DUF427 family)